MHDNVFDVIFDVIFYVILYHVFDVFFHVVFDMVFEVKFFNRAKKELINLSNTFWISVSTCFFLVSWLNLTKFP